MENEASGFFNDLHPDVGILGVKLSIEEPEAFIERSKIQ